MQMLINEIALLRSPRAETSESQEHSNGAAKANGASSGASSALDSCEQMPCVAAGDFESWEDAA